MSEVAADPSISTVILSSHWTTQTFPNELRPSLQILVDAGKRVYVTDDLPDYPFPAYACKYRQALFMPPMCERPSSDYWREYNVAMAPVTNAVHAVPGTELLNTAHYFCAHETWWVQAVSATPRSG